MDVYQGKHAFNAGIDKSIMYLPTTQKYGVLNAMIATGMLEETRGSRHLSLDNRYACPELLFALRELCRIDATGTCQQRRKGWDKDTLCLKKTAKRGSYMFAYDREQRVLAFQWNDNRVVNGVLTLIDSSLAMVQRRVGPALLDLQCPK